MQLIFLHGMPGVGKLTVAKAISHLTRFPVFHNHLTVDLVGSVFEFGSTPFVELRESIWLSVFQRAVEEDLPGLIFTFVFESTVRPKFTDRVASLVESFRGEVIFVELKCDFPELEKRLVSPSRAAYQKLRSVSKLKELCENGIFQTPAISRQNFVIDTTTKTPEETAKVIVDQFGLLSLKQRNHFGS